LWGEEVAHIYNEYLWVEMGHRTMEHHFGQTLEKLTTGYCGVGLSPRPYRQVVIAIARTYLGSEYEIDEDEDDMLAQQSCHGPNTRIRLYGTEEGHLPSMSSDTLLRFGHVSQAWWRLVQFMPGSSPVLPIRQRRHIQEHYSSHNMDTPVQQLPSANIDTNRIIQHLTATISSTISQMKVDLAEQIQKSVAAGITEALNRQSGSQSMQQGSLLIQAQPIRNPGDVSTWNPHDLDDLYADDHNAQDVLSIHTNSVLDRNPDDDSVQGNISSHVNNAIGQRLEISQIGPSLHLPLSSSMLSTPLGEDTLQGLLQGFFPDKLNVQFKSSAQKDMVKLAISREHSFVGILPTGGGKSLVFMLPTLREAGLTTIVVVPNKALLRDMMRKATEAGIDCIHWRASSKDFTNQSLMFVALETSNNPKFTAYVFLSII
jgi:hypothetical protein